MTISKGIGGGLPLSLVVFDKKLDTWDFYQGGKITQRLRDSDANGRVDQWWTWPNPDRHECAVIASDHDGDGQPDPDAVVDVCAIGTADAGAPATASRAAPAGTAADSGAASAAPKAESASAATAAPTDAGTSDAGRTKKAKKASK